MHTAFSRRLPAAPPSAPRQRPRRARGGRTRRSAPGHGLGRRRAAPRGLDPRRRMGSGRTARDDAGGAARGKPGGMDCTLECTRAQETHT
jgi:hypothetical protein